MSDAESASGPRPLDLAPVIEFHPDPAFLADPSGTLLAVNPPMCAWLGRSSDQLIGSAFDPVIAPYAPADVRAHFASAANGQPVRFRGTTQHPSGDFFTAEVTMSPIVLDGEVVAVMGFAVDSAASDARELEARASRELVAIAGRIARFGGWAIDAATGTISLSTDAQAMLGWVSSSTISLDDALRLIPEPDRSLMGRRFQRCLIDGEPLDVTTNLITLSGELMRIRFIAEPERDARGAVSRVHGAIWAVSADEAARATVADAQRHAEQQAALLDNATDAMIVRDLDNRVVYWNRAAEEIYGWSADEAVGRSVEDLVHDDREALTAATRELLEAGHWFGELVQRTREGRELVMDCRWQVILDEDGEPVSIFAVNSDITEYRRNIEAQVRDQRMESLGTLAGGIAHDLNNVLTPILMSVQLLGHDESDPVRIEVLRGMESAVKRGAEMIRQVLSYARGIDGRRVRVSTPRLVGDVIAFARDTLPRSIVIESEMAPELADSTGDPTQLMQVLTNLVSNAADAMPDGGTLHIEASNRTIDASRMPGGSLAKPGDFVVISVEDTGHGMTAATMERIFEPFFTTKSVGHGSGLGLAASLAIVRSHGGLLTVDSTLGSGTRFDVAIPVARGRSVAAPVARERVVANRRGDDEMVLVVDDEPSIRQTLCQTLEVHGYRTMAAANGREAIDIIEGAGVTVDLVITDMMMPVMDGAETSAYLEEHHPTIPIIAASGLASSGAVSRSVGMGITRFLAKPFAVDLLLSAVHETLLENRSERRDAR